MKRALALGLYVFPVKAGKKVPAIMDWERQASNDPKQIEEWAERFPGCNWGCPPARSGLTVLDLDVKGDKNGEAVLWDLEMQYCSLPDTLSARTPSGGKHLYFKGATASSIGKLGPGIDVKSKGGYVVIPDSSTPEGSYEWLDEHRPIAYLPETWAEILGQPVDIVKVEPVSVDLDNPEAVSRAIEYLMVAEPSIEGSHGDNNAYRVACRVREFGISRDCAATLMLKWWNDRCRPPWSFEEIERFTENAEKYSRRPAGSDSPEADFAEIVAPGPQAAEELPDGDFFEHELIGDPEPLKWVLEEWLPSGEVSSLYGDGGQGKTLLAIYMGYCVSQGIPFYGIPTTQMPVLACLSEDKRAVVHHRIKAIRDHHLLQPNPKAYFRFFASPGSDYTMAIVKRDGALAPGPFYHHLKRLLGEMPEGPKFIILDNLADVFAGNENIRDTVTRFIKVVLRGLCTRFNASTLLLAHPSRAGMASGDNLSGSTGWNNAVRNRLSLQTHKDFNHLRVLVKKKANWSESGVSMCLKWNNGMFIHTNEEQALTAALDAHGGKIIAAVKDARNNGGPLGRSRNHANSIYTTPIFDAEGNRLTKEIIDQIVDALILGGKLIEIKGSKKGKNGIYTPEQRTQTDD